MRRGGNSTSHLGFPGREGMEFHITAHPCLLLTSWSEERWKESDLVTKGETEVVSPDSTRPPLTPSQQERSSLFLPGRVEAQTPYLAFSDTILVGKLWHLIKIWVPLLKLYWCEQGWGGANRLFFYGTCLEQNVQCLKVFCFVRLSPFLAPCYRELAFVGVFQSYLLAFPGCQLLRFQVWDT